ncbi:MAG: hypothetical protein ACI841_004514 [Planctomycetota bacterium]|jgi:hypothetical protein
MEIQLVLPRFVSVLRVSCMILRVSVDPILSLVMAIRGSPELRIRRTTDGLPCWSRLRAVAKTVPRHNPIGCLEARVKATRQTRVPDQGQNGHGPPLPTIPRPEHPAIYAMQVHLPQSTRHASTVTWNSSASPVGFRSSVKGPARKLWFSLDVSEEGAT